MNPDEKRTLGTGCVVAMLLSLLGLGLLMFGGIAAYFVFSRAELQSEPVLIFDGEDSQSMPDRPEHASPVEPPPAPEASAQLAPADSPPGSKPAPGEPAYLADLKPIEVSGVAKRGGEVTRKIRLAGRWHEHGLWVQPAVDADQAQLDFSLKAQPVRLRGLAGISEAQVAPAETDQGLATAVVFRIYGDGNLRWESPPLKDRGASAELDIDLSGVTQLTLVAEKSNRAAAAPECVWGDLELVPIVK